MLFAMRCATAIPQETDQTRAPGIGQRVRYREDREHRRDFAIRMNPTCAFESPDQIAHDGIHQQLIFRWSAHRQIAHHGAYFGQE